MLRDRRNGPPEPGEANPWSFVRRWPDAAVRSRVWPVISRLLLDADPVVRERAVEFVRGWDDGAALTAPRLIEVASQHAELYADQAIEGMTLRYALAFALSNRVTPANGAQIAALLRELAKRDPIVGSAASVLGRYEPTFVSELAPKYGDAQVDWIAEAAGSMAQFRRDSVVPFVTALRGLSQETRTRVLAMRPRPQPQPEYVSGVPALVRRAAELRQRHELGVVAVHDPGRASHTYRTAMR